MTEAAKQKAAEAKTVEEKIKAVNKILLDGEPGNISMVVPSVRFIRTFRAGFATLVRK